MSLPSKLMMKLVCKSFIQIFVCSILQSFRSGSEFFCFCRVRILQTVGSGLNIQIQNSSKIENNFLIERKRLNFIGRIQIRLFSDGRIGNKFFYDGFQEGCIQFFSRG